MPSAAASKRLTFLDKHRESVCAPRAILALEQLLSGEYQ